MIKIKNIIYFAIAFSVCVASTMTYAQTHISKAQVVNTNPKEENGQALHTGQASFFNGGYTGGSAMLGPIDQTYYLAALNKEDYNNGELAGAYLEVTGDKGTAYVLVSDMLYEGKKGDLNISEAAYRMVTDSRAQSSKVTWKVIALPTKEPISYKFKEGSSKYWCGIQIRNHRYPVAKVELVRGDGTTQLFIRENYNYFIGANLGNGPYTFRVTDIYGNVCEDEHISISDKQIVKGKTNLGSEKAGEITTPPQTDISQKEDKTNQEEKPNKEDKSNQEKTPSEQEKPSKGDKPSEAEDQTPNNWAKEYAPETIHTGDATYYGGGYVGGCAMLDPVSRDYDIAAMNIFDYNDALMAGAYLEVTGEKGKINVLITDLLPEGQKGDLDLYEDTFEKIIAKEKGRVKVTWRVIAFPTDEPISYKFKEGSSQYWCGVQVRNHRYPVAKLEYKNAKGEFVTLHRERYNYFISSEMGKGPFTFRVTDIYGHVIIDKNIPLTLEHEVKGKANFEYLPNEK